MNFLLQKKRAHLSYIFSTKKELNASCTARAIINIIIKKSKCTNLLRG